MASIDTIIARFAAYMALAEGKKPVDICLLAGGSTKKTSQSYLLRRVLTYKEVDIWALKSHFRWIWGVEKSFKV